MNTTEAALYAVLTDEALAERLEMLAENIRSFSPTERSAILAEAARRFTRQAVRMRRQGV